MAESWTLEEAPGRSSSRGGDAQSTRAAVVKAEASPSGAIVETGRRRSIRRAQASIPLPAGTRPLAIATV